MKKPSLVPLDRFASGRYGIVRELQGGAEFVSRLAGMGLTQGTRIEVLQNIWHGPVLVRAHESRIALGRGEAAKILVEETDGPSASG
jgi:ferrous iron transport protein A